MEEEPVSPAPEFAFSYVRHDMRLRCPAGCHQLSVFTELGQYQFISLNGFLQYLLLTNVQ